jgi:hypothetical protein
MAATELLWNSSPHPEFLQSSAGTETGKKEGDSNGYFGSQPNQLVEWSHFRLCLFGRADDHYFDRRGWINDLVVDRHLWDKRACQ